MFLLIERTFCNYLICLNFRDTAPLIRTTESRFYEPARLSTPPKPLFSLNPLDVTTWLRSLLSKVFLFIAMGERKSRLLPIRYCSLDDDIDENNKTVRMCRLC